MTEKGYSKTTLKFLRGLRQTTDGGELQLALDTTSTPSSPPRKHKKVVPIYGLPILAHCPKYGEFWRPKIIGHEIVNVEESTVNSAATKDDTLDDGTGNCGAGKYDGDGTGVPMRDADVCYHKKHDDYMRQTASDTNGAQISQEVDTALSHYENKAYKVLRGPVTKPPIVNTDDNTENEDAASSTSAASDEQGCDAPVCPAMVDEDEEMEGLFGVYARDH